MKERNLKTYNEVIEEISNTESHLLLANGFNNGLGVDLSYESIFTKMKETTSEYGELIINNNYDIEGIIGNLKQQIKKDSSDSQFLENFINNKVKSDFMKASYALAKQGIKNIYNDQNKDIGLLFKNFTNYFTLNYDPFLYLLLMKYKKVDEERAILFQNTLNFKINDINIKDEDVYQKIKKIYNSYSKELVDVEGKKIIDTPFSRLNKTDFEKQLKDICKKENIKFEKKHLEVLYEELEQNKTKGTINDGFTTGQLFNIKPQIDKYIQNVFFLHGAFHIYKENKSIYKITKTQDKALYEKLDEIIDAKNKDIVCVFTNENKISEINKNDYLKKGIKKLSSLNGSLVIIGSSLAENDIHIFKRINNSSIKSIYYASSINSQEKHYNRLKELFPEKEIILFDRETISYQTSKN